MVVKSLGLSCVVVWLLFVSACSQLDHHQSVVLPATVEVKSALVFEPDHVDMGTVKEGHEATVFLRVRNAGDVMANIVAVETSCGCSVAEPEDHLLMPGAFTRIKVVVDTFAKQGDAKKWVSLTDDLGRSSKVWLTLNVQANPHLNVGSRSIFNGKCAACHFDTAKDQVKGPQIYAAVCSMCHGDNGQGAVAPSLKHHNDAGVLALLIANGTGSQHMPGFALQQGGPLSDSQITALSEWLSTLDETGQKR
ncbi:DUF1573 domain-containing protein [Mariprofundus sp. EBB-1]|uniref:DUF1573 domain-containing protein n=1 Tax=Mariprofundus sp. EBB-1 TaxID=2650971 RepID=UPI000EF2395F|nr:DUF1573 domain-containing protein [Mariprofundus sp. EBB-1]RLL55965.1 DUF1573 domain-containing protein [Mariprofundus sp. EBB-1]